MAYYRQIYMTFWSDAKIDEDFSPEDKYFYLYLLTNPHTNLCGCYEVGIKAIASETGYNRDTVEKLLRRMEEHGVIRYDRSTKEVLLLNWHKYNWSKSADTLKGVEKETAQVKSKAFQEMLYDMVENVRNETPYRPPIDPRQASVTVTDTVTVSDTASVKKKVPKHKYGEYGNVLLTDEELRKLQERYHDWHERITEMDEAIERKGYKYKSHYLAILEWARKDIKQKQSNGYNQFMNDLRGAVNGE